MDDGSLEVAINGVLHDYTTHQKLILRIVSIVSSCISIIFGLVGFYSFINMNRKAFRHRLILLLIAFDFGKAVILLWYPVRVLEVPDTYLNVNFCDVIGFFTSCFIEGADLAVLTLAVHTALVIFLKDGSGAQGGLYPFRKIVYAFHFLLPITLASLAFIQDQHNVYLPIVTWCYLPMYPFWLRLALSWVPRYIIIITIITIYIAIYVHVKLQYRQVTKNFRSSQQYTTIKEQTPFGYLRDAWKHVLRTLASFPGLKFLICEKVRDNINQSEMEMGTINAAADSSDPQIKVLQEFQDEAMVKFQRRRNMIEKQVRFMFVYPIAYVFLWIAPLVVYAIQFHNALDFDISNTGSNHNGSGLFWISAIAEWMQPFNCTVDTIVFIILEKPWRDRTERVFTKNNLRFIRYIRDFFAPKGNDDHTSPGINFNQSSRNGSNMGNSFNNKDGCQNHGNMIPNCNSNDGNNTDGTISSPNNSWKHIDLEFVSVAPINRTSSTNTGQFTHNTNSNKGNGIHNYSTAFNANSKTSIVILRDYGSSNSSDLSNHDVTGSLNYYGKGEDDDNDDESEGEMNLMNLMEFLR